MNSAPFYQSGQHFKTFLWVTLRPCLSPWLHCAHLFHCLKVFRLQINSNHHFWNTFLQSKHQFRIRNPKCLILMFWNFKRKPHLLFLSIAVHDSLGSISIPASHHFLSTKTTLCHWLFLKIKVIKNHHHVIDNLGFGRNIWSMWLRYLWYSRARLGPLFIS